jgi:acetyl esterase/lipase
METFEIIYPPEGTRGIPSVDVGRLKRKYLDIPYASRSPSQKLDIYLPAEGDGPFPTLIFMHGGAFVFGQKQDTQLLHAIEGINHGYAVASVEYRTGFEAQFPAALFDLKAAIRFLRANAALYKLNGNRFASGGDSAGGYYAVLAAATQGNPAYEGLSLGSAAYSSAVSAVVSWYGVYDLLLQNGVPHEPIPDFPDIDKLLLGAPSKDVAGLLHFTNPLNFITRDFPPVFIQHGSDDHTVSVRQAHMLEEKVSAVCGADRVALELLEGFDHGGIDPRSYEKQYAERAFAFLDKYLK